MRNSIAEPRTGNVRHVLVLHHYAMPRSQSGGTRHVDLFSRVDGWSPLIVASSRHHQTQKSWRTDDERFKLAWVPSYIGAGLARMAGWAIFAAQAAAIGLTRRTVDAVNASTRQMLVPVAGRLSRVSWNLSGGPPPEACREVGDVGLERLYSSILEDNDASLKAYTNRCGWQVERTSRKHVWRHGGLVNLLQWAFFEKILICFRLQVNIASW
jgi:hypothetical protein